MLAARRVGVGARAPRGPRSTTSKLLAQPKTLKCLPPRCPAATRGRHLILASRTRLQTLHAIPSRFYSQLPESQRPVMTKEELAKARDYKTILKCAPDDVELARVIFKDIKSDGGATLTPFLATTIVSALLKEGSLEESVEAIEYARDRRIKMKVHPSLYAKALSMSALAKQYAHVLCMWDAMRAGDCRHSPWQYRSALVAALRLKQERRVLEILDEVKASQTEDDKLCELALEIACQTKQHKLVCGILASKHASGADSTAAYRSTRQMAFKLGQYDLALELLRVMKEHGVDPTEEYKHQVLSLHKAALHGQVLSVFEAMRIEGCDEDTFGAVVASAVNMKDPGAVMTILGEMKQNVDTSKVRTEVFPRAVRAAIWTNQHELALDLFDFMNQAGVSADATVVSAIRTAFKSKQYEFVFDILRKEKEGRANAREEYAHVVMSFYKLKCYDHVLRAFRAMRDCGYDPSEIIVKTALKAAIALDRQGDVVAICGGSGSKLSLYSFALEQARAANKQALVDSILDNIKQSSTDRAKSTAKKSTTPAKKPTTPAKKPAVTATKPVVAASTADDTGAVPVILAEHLEKIPNRVEAHSAALLVADESSGMQDMVPRILDHLLTIAKTPSAVYVSMLRSANRAKRHRLVMAITDHAAKNDVHFTGKMYKIILQSCARENDLESALGLRRAIQDRGLGMTEGTAYSLIKCAAKVDEWDVVIDIMSELRSENLKPTMAMYAMAFNECTKRGHLNRAVDIYNVMPESLRVQLSGVGLRVAIRGHAYSESKELQLRASDIINEFRHTLSPKKYNNIVEEVHRIIQEEAARKSASLDSMAKPSGEEDASVGTADTSSKGVFGYFSSLFKR